ncbi:MAG: hypothetical protein IPJ17_17235 [Holophagales bacterium]|nr:MAG: hypothetical protein IPJ17_17235 [Holophagales bacterium]
MRHAPTAGAVLALTVASLVGGCAPAPPQTSPSFYRDARPYTRWWWFAAEMEPEAIARQLDWFKAQGFGGVEIAWVYPLNIPRYQRFYPWVSDEQRSRVEPRAAWLSPEWSDRVAFAKRYADRIGLGCDFTFGSAWPFGDSRVTPEDSAKVYGDPAFQQEIVISWEYPQTGRVLDHLSRPAFERYAARMGGALEKATRTGAPSGLFCDSWEVETRKIWTDGLGEAFARRYGYAIEPYMNEILSPGNAGPRYDYMKLVSETVIREFYVPFTEASHRLGAFSRVQVAGAPVDLIAAYSRVDVPETEALLFEPPFARIVASAAALAGRRDVTSETFTCAYGFPRVHHKEEQTADLKLIADAVFANGVNQIVWHGAPFDPQAPGHDNEFYASVHVGRQGALASELKAFNRYLETVSGYLKRGRTYADVAVYLPTEDAWVRGELPQEEQLPWGAWGAYELRTARPPRELDGYQPLWVDREQLERARVANGRIRIGDLTFRQLYLDVEYLDRNALAAIVRLAKAGARVTLKRHPQEPGLRPAGDYASLLAELAAQPGVSSRLTISAPLVEGEGLPDFWARDVDGELLIFFAQPLAQHLTLPLRYGQSRMTSPLERTVRIRANGRSSVVRLEFQPYQSLLLKVDRRGRVRFVDITFVPKSPRSEAAAVSHP